MQEQPHQLPTLHQRASVWFEQNGLPADAIRHALAAEDFERAAGLVELAWRRMDRTYQSAAWLGWVKALPDELVRARPVLSAEYAWALLDCGELEAGDARLRDVEQWLDTRTDMSGCPEGAAVETCPEVPPEPVEGQSRRMVVVEEQFWSLPLMIANARAYYAQAVGDVPGSVKYARRALDLLPLCIERFRYVLLSLGCCDTMYSHGKDNKIPQKRCKRSATWGTARWKQAGQRIAARLLSPLGADIECIWQFCRRVLRSASERSDR